MSQQVRQEIWDKFLAQWPIEKLHEMTLTEYTQLNNPCFSRCIKYENDQLGVARWISGWHDGIGVYAWNSKMAKYPGRLHDEVRGFGWKHELGETLDEAFGNLIAHVAAIATEARNGKFDLLLKKKMLDVKFEWKLAFMYQDQSNLKLLPVQDITLLATIRRRFMQPPLISVKQIDKVMDANLALMSIRDGKPIFEYVDELQAILATDEYGDEDESDDPGVYQKVCESSEEVEMTVSAPLNVVLYGPPGTGKTYGTIDEALTILDPDLVLSTMGNANSSRHDRREHRRLRKAGFDALVRAQRVRFVTFHQSFSYEDFVEGLRAVEEDASETGITYRVEPGIFKQICTDAQRNAQLADELQKTGVSFLSGPTYKAPQLPYVLIIDEINRGNVSRIFGELITLIEPSKRAGANEALSVTLPYSKQHFSVPGNVHLIGTMNTADRSLSGLDIALRRRFVFKEKPPLPELLHGVFVEGLDVGEMLAVINQRIEVLLDRDHLLGHAYFMALADEGANTLTHLSGIFRHQVLPLLQEYFFEDWERICWVLNDHRKKIDAHCFVINAVPRWRSCSVPRRPASCASVGGNSTSLRLTS